MRPIDVKFILSIKHPLVFDFSAVHENILTAGCTGYIEKSFDPLKVMAKISKIIWR